MITSVITAFTWLLFYMSILNIVRHFYYLIQAIISTGTENEVRRYTLNTQQLITLWVSVAYMLTFITI